MASLPSNKFRYLLGLKVINFSSDTFKLIFMEEGFIFNPDTHAVYADVSASEQATNFGYTSGGITMTGGTVTQNDTDDRAYVTFNNVTLTASGGDIGPVCGAIIYDDTVASPVVDPIIGFIDFAGVFTEPDGGVATIANIRIKI